MTTAKWELTKQLAPVVKAHALLYENGVTNHRNHSHFYFYGLGDEILQVHWFAGVPSYTVGNTSTTSEIHAIALLEGTK